MSSKLYSSNCHRLHFKTAGAAGRITAELAANPGCRQKRHINGHLLGSLTLSWKMTHACHHTWSCIDCADDCLNKIRNVALFYLAILHPKERPDCVGRYEYAYNLIPRIDCRDYSRESMRFDSQCFHIWHNSEFDGVNLRRHCRFSHISWRWSPFGPQQGSTWWKAEAGAGSDGHLLIFLSSSQG